MTSPGLFGVSGGLQGTAETSKQAAGRRYMRRIDQHGRRWGMIKEGVEGRHVGVMEFLRSLDHNPPYLPPPQYLKYVTKADPNDPDAFLDNRITVDYSAWKADIKQAWTDFTTAVHEEYAKRNLVCDWTPSGGVAMRMDVRKVVGIDPSPLQLVLACEQGNKWALYGQGTMPKVLAPFFGARVRSQSVLAGIEETFDLEDDSPAIVAADLDDEWEAKGFTAGSEPVIPRGIPKAKETWARHLATEVQSGKTAAQASESWKAKKAALSRE